jgi:hypothetical protein
MSATTVDEIDPAGEERAEWDVGHHARADGRAKQAVELLHRFLFAPREAVLRSPSRATSTIDQYALGGRRSFVSARKLVQQPAGNFQTFVKIVRGAGTLVKRRN